MREISIASRTPSTRDLAHNPGTCSDWELNQRPFSLQAGTQSTELHKPGLISSFLLSQEDMGAYFVICLIPGLLRALAPICNLALPLNLSSVDPEEIRGTCCCRPPFLALFTWPHSCFPCPFIICNKS